MAENEKAKKIIRSHSVRAKRAKEIIEGNAIFADVSWLDKEAIVEFLLLEDIRELSRIRLERAKLTPVSGRLGEKAKEANIQKFAGLVALMDEAIAAANLCLVSGEYKKVRKAIDESALMSAASSIKRIGELIELAKELVGDMSKAALEVEKTFKEKEECVDEIEDHEKNVRDASDTLDANAAIASAAETIEKVRPMLEEVRPITESIKSILDAEN